MINSQFMLGVVSVFIIALSGCGIETDPLSLYGDTGTLLSQIRFEHRAYNIAMGAPYDTVTLKAHGFTMHGDTLDVPVTYEVLDHLSLEIDSNNVLRAKKTVSSAWVKAYSTSADGVTRRDSVYVSVAAAAPTVMPKRVALEHLPGDSAKFGNSMEYGRGKSLNLIREDENGNNMNALIVGVRSSDISKSIITVSGSTVRVTWRLPGQVIFYISSYAYGRAFSDSLQYLLGFPVSGYIAVYGRIPGGSKDIILDFHPKRLIVGMGACVHWRAPVRGTVGFGIMTGIEFDDPMNALAPSGSKCLHYDLLPLEDSGGDIAPFKYEYVNPGSSIELEARSGMRARIFPKAGLYKYRHPVYGTEGEILVCDEKNDKECSPENYKWEDGR